MKNTNFKLKTKVLNRAVHTSLLLLAAGLLFTGCPQKAKPVYYTVSLVHEGGNLTANPEIQDGKVLKDSEITFTASPTNLSTHEVDKWEAYVNGTGTGTATQHLRAVRIRPVPRQVLTASDTAAAGTTMRVPPIEPMAVLTSASTFLAFVRLVARENRTSVSDFHYF